MKLPSNVKVAGHVFNVLFPYKFREVENKVGQCDVSLNEIRLKDNDGCGNKLNSTVILSTFIHEILEAINEMWTINLEHDQILRLEKGVCAVLLDNKWLK